MSAVTLQQVLEDQSYLLGESSVPDVGIEDRKRFIQRALERIYGLHDFPMNKINATIALIAGTATLPTNAGQDSEIDLRDATGQVYDQIPYEEQQNYVAGDRKYWLEGYEGTGTYLLKSSDPDKILKIRYTTSVPVLNATISTPFPSSMAIAQGSMMYIRQSEDPQADISQEDAVFKQSVEEVWRKYRRNSPQRRARGVHERSGTYTGDTRRVGG